MTNTPRHLHLDFETFSLADLESVGVYRYAFDPSTEILCMGMALDDAPPVIWHPYLSDQEIDALQPYWEALQNPEVLVYAFNAGMEIAVCKALMEKTLGIPAPDIKRFRCAQSIARRAALPAGLDKLGEVLNLSTQKDKRGKALIKIFCVMQAAKKATKKKPAIAPHRIYPLDDWPAFLEFLEYCKTDVVAERAAVDLLSYFDEPINNANYTLHAIINDRGVAVNVAALRHAQTLIEEESELVGERFRDLTGFEYTQNKVLLAWLHENGCDFENLQAETIDSYLDKYGEIPSGENVVIDALRMKQSVAYVSIKKVRTMLDCVGPLDNRIRGMLNHHAATTGRSSNSLVQFQNMKRATINSKKVAWSEYAYADICNGVSREMLEICYGPVLEVISSCIRHFVHDVQEITEQELYEDNQALRHAAGL